MFAVSPEEPTRSQEGVSGQTGAGPRGPLPCWPLQWQAGPNQSSHGGDSTLSKGPAAGNEQKTSYATKINDAHVAMCVRRR